MSQVVRYFHLRAFMSSHGGTTVKVTGDLDSPGQVDIQWVKCSKKDNYCKKTGRSLADKASTKIIPLRYLPKELDALHPTGGTIYGGHAFAIKYFLPKEL